MKHPASAPNDVSMACAGSSYRPTAGESAEVVLQPSSICGSGTHNADSRGTVVQVTELAALDGHPNFRWINVRIAAETDADGPCPTRRTRVGCTGWEGDRRLRLPVQIEQVHH